MNNIPDRLNIDKDDRILYEEIKLFEGKENKEKFIFAMAYGFFNNLKFPLKKKEGYILNKYLVEEDEALIYSLAIKSSGTAEILLDMQKVYEVVEEYAHAGLKLLHEETSTNAEFGSFNLQLEKKLFEEFNKNKMDE